MAAEIDHINLANKTHHTLVYLMKDIENHSEWVTTVAFYKSVHVIEAIFANRKFHSNGHDARLRQLKCSSDYKEVFKAYRPLYAASLVARYLDDNSKYKFTGQGSVDHYQQFSDFLSPQDVVNRLLKKRLNALEQNAVSLLSETAKDTLLRIQPVFDV